MPGVVRLGDAAVHGCYGPHYPTVGSPNVTVDGLPVIIKNTPYTPHTCGDDTHDGIASGDCNVYVNGQPVQKVGDSVSCGSVMVQGSGSVSIG